MHKLCPRASCNIHPTLLVSACLILTTPLSLTLSHILSFSLSLHVSCLQNMKGTCCRCCLTSATSLSHSSLNVFLQDHKSPLSSLVWICACVCLSQCASMGVRVCAHMLAWLSEDCSLTLNKTCITFEQQISSFYSRGQKVPFGGVNTS